MMTTITFFNQLTAMPKRLAMVLTMLLIVGIGQAWGETYILGWGSASGTAGAYTNFTTTSGTVNNIVSFSTAKNSGSAPAYNSNNSELRLYYASNGSGGSITLTPATGITITEVVMKTSTTPSVKYTVDGGTATSVSPSNQVYTISGISATTSLKIQNVNTTNTQLRIKTIEITYTTGSGGDSGDDSGDVSGGNSECTWQLVTDASTLKVGDEIVIAASDANYALGTTQNSKNRSATAITQNNNNTITIDDKVQIITLCDGLQDNTLGFSVGSAGFLYAASSSENQLKSKSIRDNNCDWVISITNGIATIKAQGTYTRNIMRYNPNNSSSPIFACYASSSTIGSLPAIYKKVCTTEMTQLATPTNLQSKNITSTSADLSWEWPEETNADKLSTYYLYIKKEGDANFTGPITYSGNSCSRTGLDSETKYIWKVQAISRNNEEVENSEESETSEFTTLKACTDAVNVTKGTPSNGSFTMVSGYQSTCNGTVTVTLNDIQPDAGYQFSTITQSGVDNAKVTIDNDAKTVTYAQNTTGKSTINVIFTEIPKRTVTLNPNFPTGKTGTFTYEAGELVDGSLVLSYDDGTASMTIAELYTSLTLDGYEFGGWYNAKGSNPGEVSGSKCENTGNITGDKTYYAKWSKLYTITLSENGTKTTLTPQTSTSYTLPDDLTAGSCQDDTKEFVGWTTISDLNSATEPTTKYYAKGEIVTLSEDETTFFAVFATPDGSGGSGSVDYSSTHTSNVPINAGTAITNTNVIIESKEYAATKAGTSSASGSVDVTIPAGTTQLSFHMAGWNGEGGKTITLTGATADPSSFKTIADAGVSGNGKYTLSGDVAQYAYSTTLTNITQETKITFANNGADQRFVIWGVNASTEVSYSDYTTTCDNTKATVTYDLNGGTGAACEQTTVTKDEAFNLCSSTPTKNGYTFAGWSDGTKTYAAGAEVTISESTTFYATWTAKTITITWDQNYSNCPESETSTYIYDGEEIEMPEDPIRKGYKFTGWFTESSDGTQITEVGETNKPSADVTYYAHWAEQYSVTYIASGQQYIKQEYKYISGDKLVLPEIDPSAANFACDGYLFEGWSKFPQTKEDAKCPELVDANTSVENDLELHAVWKKAGASGAGTQIFYESFNKYTSPGGNDDNFNTASSDKDNTISNSDNSGWSGNNVYGAKACVKLGGGSAKGTITTPTITSLSGDATLSFKAAAWNGNNDKTTLNLLISGGGSLDKTSVTLVKGAWQTYEVAITDGTPSSKVTFEAAYTSDNRFFLDEVIITTSGSYNYTTSPNCGPTMVAKESVWATSANGQSVKVNVPVGVKLFTGAATITGTSTNENFVVNTLENAGNGEHQVVVVYTPTADDTKENTTITLTAKNGEDTWATTTFVLNGRSLPNEFVVVANRGDKNYALPANMTEAGTYAGLVVEVNGEEVIAAPKSHLYNVRAVHSTRFAENGTALRLVGNNDACLWASNAVSGTSIRNWAKLINANTANYEWNLYTEDGDTYYISSTAVTEEGRVLRLDGTNFGMYKQGVDAFRLLPVGCTSTPMNVQTSTTRTSATISWTNASACDLVVKQGETLVQNLSASVSPVVVSGLAESTAYTFTLTPTDNASCGVSGSFNTTGPTIDIVEWHTGGIRIYVDKDEKVNPKVIINGEEEHGNVGGQVATELFFSKYYEAHAENKLLAVYNGTTQTIDLNGYVIKHGSVEIDLSQYGQTEGSIAPNEEIILVAFDDETSKSAESCAEKEEGFNTWNVLEKELLAFSGRGSVGLYKNDVLIDLIGSIYPSGELTKIGKAGSPDNCGTDEDVRLHVGGLSVNDQSSFFCYNGDNHKTTEVETNYPISTNRCLLIRKNTVTSGANAVASNKAEAGATCGDLSSTFTTLCSEWSGFRIGSGSSSNAEIQKATCEGIGYVGGFDYNNYYRTMEPIHTGKTLDQYDRNPNDDTYFIEFENVSDYSCLNIQLQLTDEAGNVLTDQITQVPILVYGNKTTTNELFSAIVKNGETPDYENSKIRCATCDVVIQSYATLTKAAPDTENDVNQVRDIYVYPGGKLIVPEGADDYNVNSVSLRRDQDEVASASIQAPLNITSSSKTPVYVDIRINSENWHWMTLPYNCNIADVTWNDGSKAIYNSDWFLMYYDGESRSKEQSHYENHWKVYEGTTIEAGKGYIVGITGHPTKSGVQYELRFPMPTDVLTADNQDKTVPVNSWGIEDDITANKKGWNLVGNPYLDYYQRSAVNSFNGLRLGGEYEYDETTGKWHDTGMWDGIEKNLPYIVVPVDGGWTSYDQVLASEIDLKPFTSYFVQVGNSGDTNGQRYDVQFAQNKRGRASLIRRAPSEIDEVEEPVIVGVSLTNTQGESDKTSLIIDNQYTDEYEMNADFFKWFGDYYRYYTKPVLYTIGADDGKRAFNAISEELATQPISLGMYAAQAGDYTFTLDRRSDLSKVQEVWLYDATQDTYTNLLQDGYTFQTTKTESAGRFFLSVKMAPKVSTDINNVTDGTIWATTQDHTIIVNGLLSNSQLWIYDATGKLLHTDQPQYYQHSYSVPQSGTYFVRVQNTMQTQTIKVVVE